MTIIAPIPEIRPQNRRRSKRVLKSVPVVVRLRDAGKQSLAEKTEAIIVNDHGALILLAAVVKVNQIIRVENPTIQRRIAVPRHQRWRKLHGKNASRHRVYCAHARFLASSAEAQASRVQIR